MKRFKNWIVVPAAVAMFLASAGMVRSQIAEIKPGFQPDLVVRGTSGGSQASKNCGMIAATPNVVVNLSENFNYLRFSVQGAGQPTLLIQAPNGSSCVQADNFSGGKIEAPGYWEKGSYSIYVGDRAGGQHPYTLTITQKRS
jgi:hypothetical protein